MSLVVVTTISCDAVILCCLSCQAEVAVPSEAFVAVGTCACGAMLRLDRRCGVGFSLGRDAILIRCIAENKNDWRCENRGGRDYCPNHAHLADASRVEKPTPQAIGDA